MLSPDKILTWLESNVKGMRRSRAKTLASIVPAGMARLGLGTLALGRAMRNGVSCKHNIKRVDRFLANGDVETEALGRGVFETFAPAAGRTLVLADWTDVPNAKLLVLSLPANGRSIPFFAKAVPKHAGEGELVRAENEALAALRRMCAGHDGVVVVADRGFGNQRWLGELKRLGFHFVQRVSKVFYAQTEGYIGKLDELDLRKKPRLRDWGHGCLGEDEAIQGRLMSAFDPEAKEPWLLITDLEDATVQEAVSIYRRRWWIETTFRDKKNREWGLGLGNVHLKHPERYERLFCVAALAYIFLMAHGALAEKTGFDKTCKANTRKDRVLNLLRTGFIYIQNRAAAIQRATQELKIIVERQSAPNWG